MKWADAIPRALVPTHRALLVIATVLAAIAATLILDKPEVPDWLLLMGSAALLYVADAFRDISDDSKTLAISTRLGRDQTTQSVYATRGRALTIVFWAAAVGCVLGLGGAAVGF